MVNTSELLPLPRILATDGQVIAEGGRVYENDRYTVHWLGFVYDNSGASDQDVVASLVNSLSMGISIGDAAATLRGTFFMTVEDRSQKVRYSFVDDSALFSAYWSSQAVSTSFLWLCQTGGISSNSFPLKMLVQMLHLGNIYFGETLSPDVKKLGADEIAVESNSSVSITNKAVPALSDAPVFASLEDASSPLADAVKGKSVSVDLTGGFDSRMLACLLYAHGVKFETALAGTPGTNDAVYGQQVAEVLGVPYSYSVYDNSEIVSELDPLLARMDGLCGTFLVVHRLLQLNADRRHRGVDLSFKGSGGELYKDFFWTQDFPFYRSRNTKMSRLCGLRVEFERLSEKVLTEKASEVYEQLLQERRQRLAERYTSQFNTQSYDKVYFYERVQTWNSRTISSSMDNCPVVHSPLAELQMAQVGYQTARTNRFYNRLHRKTITNASAKASQVLTTDGTSASSTVVGQMSDGVGYARIKSKKLMKKLSQIFLNRTAFESKEYSPDEELLLRLGGTPLAQDAFEALREAELIRSDVKFEEVPRRFKESSLVLGWTLNHLR